MRPIGVGFVGTGVISELHARAYNEIYDARLVAFCDLDEIVVHDKAEAWGVDKVYTSFKDFLNDPEVEAVEILTPQHLHKEMTLAALRAGKHISVQKPMAVTLGEAQKVGSSAPKNFQTSRGL